MATGFIKISLTPAADVATNGTMTFTYPSGYTAATQFKQSGEKMVVSGLQNTLAQAADTFTLSYGGSSVVVTYKDSTTIPAGTLVTVQLPLSDYKAITLLTDSSGGTASATTVVDVPASYTEATLANQLATIVAKLNETATRVNTLLTLSAAVDNVPS